MNFSLSEEQVMLRSMARQFAMHSIEPAAMDDDHNEHFPWEMVKQMAGLGFLGAIVPQQYGGSGLDYIGYAIIIEEIAHASLSIAMSVFCSHTTVEEALITWGNEQQKRKYLPAMAKGEIFGCYAVSESGIEMDVGNINSRARFSDKQWILNGDKAFVINGGISNLALVFAKTDENQGGINAFLVTCDAAGFLSEDILGKTGLRASNIANIRLQECRIPKENLVGNLDDGFKIAKNLLDSIHFSVAASCVGSTQACIDASIKYAQQRWAFGTPISNFGMIQDMIADMIVGAETARLLIYQVADLKNKRQPFGKQLSMARYVASLAALRAAKDAIQVHGAYGYEKRSPVERYFRDVTQATLYGGSLLTHKLAVAQSDLGIHPA